MRRSGHRGFTLIELMIVVAIVGVLAVLAIYGVRKYIANAKTAEARASIGQIGKLAVIAFLRESGQTSTITLGSLSTQAQHGLCLDAVAVPTGVPAAKKYQSDPSEWKTGSMIQGWTCLSFNMDSPQYFQYMYTGSNIDVATGTFSAIARGDLNGDGVTSTFQLLGAVESGQVHTAPTMSETNPEE